MMDDIYFCLRDHAIMRQPIRDSLHEKPSILCLIETNCRPSFNYGTNDKTCISSDVHVRDNPRNMAFLVMVNIYTSAYTRRFSKIRKRDLAISVR